MKVGDLVLCTYRGRNAVCILMEDVTGGCGDVTNIWWKVFHPNGTSLTVHRRYIREMR